MTRRSVFLRLFAVAVDGLTLAFSVLCAYWVRFDTDVLLSMPEQDIELYVGLAVMTGVVGSAILYQRDRYRPTAVVFSLDIFLAILQVVTLTFAVVLVLNFWLRGYVLVREVETYSRLVLLIAWGLAIVGMTLWRSGFDAMLRRFRRRGMGLRHILIVGGDRSGRAFYKAVRRQPHLGYTPVGILEDRESDADADDEARVLGRVTDLQEVINRQRIDELIVTSHCAASSFMADIIVISDRADIRLSILPGLVELATARSWLHDVAGFPIVTVEGGILTSWGRIAKRTMDLAVISIGTVCLSPLLAPVVLLVCLSIKLDSQGPLIFQQKRMGKGGRAFDIFKFRSMRADAEMLKSELLHQNEAHGPLFKMRNDPRVTRVGRWLRRYSIDELPQLINVIRGDMSLVGPRPPLASEVANYEQWQLKRLDVTPGLVGLPQVSGRSDLIFEEVIKLDLYYIENWSIGLDLKILVQAVPVVLRGRGAY